jgi:hypothetical protein
VSNDDILRRGKRAEVLLADETFREAFDALRAAKADIGVSRQPIEQREAATHGVWALDDLKGQLQSFVDDAKMLAHRIGKTAPHDDRKH